MTFKAMKTATIILSVTLSLMTFTLADKPLPSDVHKLVEQRKSAIAKIEQTFLQELEKLKLDYTKKGDLETANRIASLITGEGGESLPNTKEELQAYLTDTKWDLGRGTKATFGLNDLLKTQNVEAKYVVTGKRTLTVTWDKKNSIRCVLDESGTKIKEVTGWRKSEWKLIP